MANLRIVNPEDENAEISMTEAIMSIVRQCIADKPNVVMLNWEAKGQMNSRCIPDSAIVQKGMISSLTEFVDPPSPEGEYP